MKHLKSDIKILAFQKAREVYENGEFSDKTNIDTVLEEAGEILDNQLQYTGFFTDYFCSMTDIQMEVFWFNFNLCLEQLHELN